MHYTQYHGGGNCSYRYTELVPMLLEGSVFRRTLKRLYSLISGHIKPRGPMVGQYTAVYTMLGRYVKKPVLDW